MKLYEVTVDYMSTRRLIQVCIGALLRVVDQRTPSVILHLLARWARATNMGGARCEQ